MKVLALDYGTKRIGAALSDETLTLARPLPFIDAVSAKKVTAEVKKRVEGEKVTLILVGLPRNMDGSHGPATEAVRAFVENLAGAIPDVKIETVDERLSTVQAGRMLQEGGHDTRAQRSKIDSAAAAILLQSWLDSRAPLMPDLPDVSV
jgi:putative holliday junction resolvase